MSLAARRDYHEFLTTPIIRQALTVVVPEYDRVAPLLTKPVRPGLHGLAHGSPLQSFALTVGIGRLAEYPVGQAIATLLWRRLKARKAASPMLSFRWLAPASFKP